MWVDVHICLRNRVGEYNNRRSKKDGLRSGEERGGLGIKQEGFGFATQNRTGYVLSRFSSWIGTMKNATRHSL